MSNVNKVILQIHSSWKSYIKNHLEDDYFTDLIKRIDVEYSKFNIFPEKKLIFNAFKLTSFEKLKVRIDQNLNRGEKSEALTEDVVKIKNKVTCLKQVCKYCH